MTSPENPYASPAADLDEDLPEVPAYTPKSASKLLRLINFIVDTALSNAVLLAFLAAVEFATPGSDDWEPGLAAEVELFSTIFILVLAVGYYVVWEATTGRTPGKYLTGTKVVDAQGQRPSFGQIVGRSLARFIPLEPLSFITRYERRGWHDRLSKTYVVKTR